MRLLVPILCYFALSSAALAECGGRLIAAKVYDAPVCVPSHPQRVAILDLFYNLGMAIELKVPIAAAPLHGLQLTGLGHAEAVASMVDLGDFKQPSLERLITLRPDLIVGNAASHAQIHQIASRIAPTLLIEDVGWKEHFRLLARATGRDAAAETALAGYEDRVSAIRARVRKRNLTVSVVRIAANGFIVYPDGPNAFGAFAVLRDAGVRRTPVETVTDSTPFKRLDWEEIAGLQSDVLLYFTVDGYDPGYYDKVEAETAANPLWRTLPAVRAGRAHRVERSTWMSFSGVGSAHSALDDIERFVLNVP